MCCLCCLCCNRKKEGEEVTFDTIINISMHHTGHHFYEVRERERQKQERRERESKQRMRTDHHQSQKQQTVTVRSFGKEESKGGRTFERMLSNGDRGEQE